MNSKRKVFLEFKSRSYYYYKEKDGTKPYTVRKLDKEDNRNYILEHGEPTHVRIVRADNPVEFFEREITDTTWMDMFGLWGIAWKHEGD
ncbi:MAG: hypothetical protein PHN89_04450 [Candidatus Pacebacteria bacterium]|nr:hypothetical protein [Candidatus Paceibacterota bacterium]